MLLLLAASGPYAARHTAGCGILLLPCCCTDFQARMLPRMSWYGGESLWRVSEDRAIWRHGGATSTLLLDMFNRQHMCRGCSLGDTQKTATPHLLHPQALLRVPSPIAGVEQQRLDAQPICGKGTSSQQ